MTQKPVLGYAYVCPQGTPSLRTVSTTETGSMVNAIAALSGGALMPHISHTEPQLRAMFDLVNGNGGRIAKVSVTVRHD